MAGRREHLPRLIVNPALNMHQQMAMGFGQGQPMFSPAIPQPGFPSPFPMNNSMQTPMQSSFSSHPPPAPGRPTHHQGSASMAHLAAGIRPPNGFPITPLAGHFPRASMVGVPGQPLGHPFPNRNRRQLSIGGPPKAVLGGPARKLSPLPAVVATNTPPNTSQKVKKSTVKLPKETKQGENGQPETRPSWARTPLDRSAYKDQEIIPVETTSAESFPPDEWRNHIPGTLEVFLPGKRAWEDMKHKAIEEKLEKLGVERGSGANVPHIHAPHARAASISSPADPQLLLFKLNKLQQSQEGTSAYNSLTPSPHPPFGVSSTSPNHSSPRFLTNRHGHTMSLANMPMHPFFDPTAATTFNPFGPNGDVIMSPTGEGIHAPQGRVPVTLSSLAPPAAVSRPTSRPDFIRGFGLDIPEEEEEEEATNGTLIRNEQILAHHEDTIDGAVNLDMEIGDSGAGEVIQPLDGTATASQSRHHSRHVSKLSAALSIRSAGALDDGFEGEEEDLSLVEAEMIPSKVEEDMDLEDVVDEWTGSEDIYQESSGGEESIGEYSNPSDEEQARQERLERRNRRRMSQHIDQPRRLPNFPRPPENTIAVPLLRDEDIISNPSEEGALRHGEYLGVEYFSRPPSNLARPFPPLHHSPSGSGQHTIHDPAHAHSRTPSDQFVYPSQQQSSAFAPRRDALNPFAKPFVFGFHRESGSWGQDSSGQMPMAPLMTHARLPSIGKPLNVAAPEFKPTGFTFRPPPGVPQMPVASSALEAPQSLSEALFADGSPYKGQGREKRLRRGSTDSIEEGDSMTSFRFPPNPESPQNIRRTPATSVSHGHKLNPSAEPFTFAGFSAVATLPYVRKGSESPVPQRVSTPEETFNDESTARAENGESQVEEFNLPSASKPKRAPIPLDFKHPVSSNTVPAGLFKALVNNGDDRTRRTVRSRLSSREIFEHMQRPSMDDTNVPTISHKISHGRLTTDPEHREASLSDDVFSSSRHNRRRSSLPDAFHDDVASSPSDNPSNPAMDLTNRIAMHQYGQKIEAILEDGLSALRHDLRREANGQHASTQSMISEIQSLFRTQLRDSAARSLEDSQMDARGELDFQLFRNIVEEGNRELSESLKHDLHGLQQQVWQVRASNSDSADTASVVEQIGNRVINAVIEAISELSARQEAINRVLPAHERDATVDNLMNALTPVLSSLRSEPIDYEFLTSQLTQAVKPHISQLIDLASDKRETANLIVDRILPLLPSRQAPTIDTDAITRQLTTEVRRVIAPIDAFEIKEQVADLVVERLDSRLAVRDKAFNTDVLSGKVVEGVTPLLEPIQDLVSSVNKLVIGQDDISMQQSKNYSSHEHLVELVSEVPSKISEELQALRTTQAELVAKLQEPSAAVSVPDENVIHIKNTVQDLADTQKTLSVQSDEIRSHHLDIIGKLDALPNSLLAAVNEVQNSHTEFVSSQDGLKREMDELRKLNTDYQIQLTKARAAHGQVRVEKDVLNEKLSTMEADRERIRSQVKELQTSNASGVAQITTLTARNDELEEALAQALARLQASDVLAQTTQERINNLEKAHQEVTSEKQMLKAKVDSHDLQLTFASRDKESALQALTTLQKQHDHLLSQQVHWDELRNASEKIETLTMLIGQGDSEELKELRRIRDRSKVLEGEHTALQKRFKEQESKMANNERAALAARQNLAQAQQRSSEWERRAKDYESQLDLVQTKLDQTEQAHAQLDADYSLAKLQLEEREADNRLAKNQQNQLRDQVAALQSELEQARAAKTPIISHRNTTNGYTHPLPRPDSRASTIYDYRSATPQMHPQPMSLTARSDTPPQASVWDSMHAPTNDSYKPLVHHHTNGKYPNLGPATPKARRPNQHYRPIIPSSPTPSTVSLTPTQGDDGWWS